MNIPQEKFNLIDEALKESLRLVKELQQLPNDRREQQNLRWAGYSIEDALYWLWKDK